MNIFILHTNAKKCAMMHCDKHVVKMILESALMLYTACWFVWYEYENAKDKESMAVKDIQMRREKSPLKVKDVAPKGIIPVWLKGAPQTKSGTVGYRPTHYNHPCSVWVRESLANYQWLCDLAWELCMEYRYRYGDEKKHACEEHIEWLRLHPPPLPDLGLTEFRQAMPDEYKVVGNAISAYHQYYIGDKADFAVWTKRDSPEWYTPSKSSKGLTFKKAKGLTFKKGEGLTFKN